MVVGKVKAAMGLQKSPSTPKPETPKHPCSPSAQQKAPSKTVFSRSFSVYFPRSSQVQPRPPDVIELVRLVEELQERESRLQTELLQHKIYKESVSIVPILEEEISSKLAEVEASLKKIECLEAANESLRQEVESLKEKMLMQESETGRKAQGQGLVEDVIAENERLKQEAHTFKQQMSTKLDETGKKMKEMENEIEELKRALEEANGGGSKVENGVNYRSSPSNRFQGLTDVSFRPNLVNDTKESPKPLEISNQESQSSRMTSPKSENENHKQGSTNPKSAHTDDERNHQIPGNAEVPERAVFPERARGPRVPKPPPKPSSAPSSLSSSPEANAVTKSRISTEKTKLPALSSFPPPPPPPTLSGKGMPPPPPPPPPMRATTSGAAKVRRVPEVVEFYHSLMRRDSKRDSSGGVPDAPSAASTRNMIGEIENRSSHLHAIKTDVETQGDFIRFLIKEVQGAAFTDIEDVVAFVKWLDDELSFLVDERAVLKHFDWPEQKADAMREAAFGYCDVKKLESEACTFSDDPRQAWAPSLKKMRTLLEKLEHGVFNLSRTRESAIKRYKELQIPTQWMLETGIVSQIKLASVKLAMKYMKRVSAELETVGSGPEEEELMVQGVRFAFRVHQFAGGFDGETMRTFGELRNKARGCQVKCHNNQQQQKLNCRSASC
ncbi:protein INCREASED PETAL GROWTH ANISOTROPY 1-like [Aristolochia californica]|uniref:protein INCREASED PETAL GROWTH ANISOTROPY 1-like n=1 Tax=Aristolochia californica TaxID=171875 RepID=UPI0035D64E04